MCLRSDADSSPMDVMVIRPILRGVRISQVDGIDRSGGSIACIKLSICSEMLLRTQSAEEVERQGTGMEDPTVTEFLLHEARGWRIGGEYGAGTSRAIAAPTDARHDSHDVSHPTRRKVLSLEARSHAGKGGFLWLILRLDLDDEWSSLT